MKFVEGNIRLVSGLTEYTVVFSPGTFVLTPTLVLFGIHNTSSSPTTKFHIMGTVTAKSVNSFDVSLNAAPNSNDYLLVWFAGGPDAVFGVQSGKRVGDLELFKGDLYNVDSLLILGRQTPSSPISMLRMLPENLEPTFQAIMTSKLDSQWVAAPETETSPGSRGQLASNSTNLFIYADSKWLKLNTVPW